MCLRGDPAEPGSPGRDLTSQGRILALDLGEAHVGVAVSDPSRTIARPLDCLRARPWDRFVDLVRDLVRDYEPEIIVVGLAVRENGSIGPEAREHRRRGERLEQCLGLPVVLHDERYTTRMATRVQRELGVRGRKAREKVHSLAACHLLTDFLDQARLDAQDTPLEEKAPGE